MIKIIFFILCIGLIFIFNRGVNGLNLRRVNVAQKVKWTWPWDPELNEDKDEGTSYKTRKIDIQPLPWDYGMTQNDKKKLEAQWKEGDDGWELERTQYPYQSDDEADVSAEEKKMHQDPEYKWKVESMRRSWWPLGGLPKGVKAHWYMLEDGCNGIQSCGKAMEEGGAKKWGTGEDGGARSWARVTVQWQNVDADGYPVDNICKPPPCVDKHHYSVDAVYGGMWITMPKMHEIDWLKLSKEEQIVIQRQMNAILEHEKGHIRIFKRACDNLIAIHKQAKPSCADEIENAVKLSALDTAWSKIISTAVQRSLDYDWDTKHGQKQSSCTDEVACPYKTANVPRLG